MKSIVDVAEQLIAHDEILFEGLRRDVLNLRATGREIRPNIEKEKMEKVGLETIVVSLSRLRGEFQKLEPVRPTVKLQDITLQTPLSLLNYSKKSLSEEDLRKIRKIMDTNSAQFRAMTEGFKEVTVVLPNATANQINKRLDSSPSEFFSNLSSVTLHFNKKFLEQPGIIFAILGELAVERINIIEVISTATELSIVVDRDQAGSVSNKLSSLL